MKRTFLAAVILLMAFATLGVQTSFADETISPEFSNTNPGPEWNYWDTSGSTISFADGVMTIDGGIWADGFWAQGIMGPNFDQEPIDVVEMSADILLESSAGPYTGILAAIYRFTEDGTAHMIRLGMGGSGAATLEFVAEIYNGYERVQYKDINEITGKYDKWYRVTIRADLSHIEMWVEALEEEGATPIKVFETTYEQDPWINGRADVWGADGEDEALPIQMQVRNMEVQYRRFPITIEGCNLNVRDQKLDGQLLSEGIGECLESASNHGALVRCIASLTNQFKKAKLITGAQKGSIMSCAAKAHIQ